MNYKDAQKFGKISSLMAGKIKSVSPFIVEDEKYYNQNSYSPEKADDLLKITTMGQWRPFYKYEQVIEACQLFRTNTSVMVDLDIVVGTTSMNSKYREKIHRLAESKALDSLEISIIEDKENILTYFTTRDVFIRSSRIDSYGICVAESLLVGTPAIATNVCHRPSNTLLYSPDDTVGLLQLLKKVYEQKKSSTEKTSMLTKNDDSYYSLVGIYHSLL